MSTKNIDASNNDLDEINLLNSLRIKEKELELELQKNDTKVENTTNTRSLDYGGLESENTNWANIHVSQLTSTSKYGWMSIKSKDYRGCLLRLWNRQTINGDTMYYDTAYIKSGWQQQDNLPSKSFLALHTASDNNPLTIRNGKVGINLTNDYDEPSETLEVKGTIKITGDAELKIGGWILDTTLLGNVAGWDYTEANYAKFNSNKRVEFPSPSDTSTTPGIMWGDSDSYSILKGGQSWDSPNFNALRLNWVTGIILDPNSSPMASGPYQKSYVWVKQGLVVGNGYSSYTTNSDKANRLIVEGNVGVGTTDPDKKLQVEGDIKLSGNLFKGSTEIDLDDYGNLSWLPDPVSDDSKYMRSKSDGTGYELVDLPTQTTTFLELTDTPNSFLSNKYLKVNSNGNAIEFVDAPSGGSGSVSTSTASSLWIQDSTQIYYNSGNVGIGETNPSANLHIKASDSSVGAILKIEADGGDGTNQPSSNIVFTTNAGGGSNYATSSNNTYISSKITSGWNRGEYDYNKSYIKFQTYSDNDSNLTDDLTIKGGNVGINTTTPSDKLEVNGNLKITGRKLRLMNTAGGTAPNDIEFSNTDFLNFIGIDGSNTNKRLSIAHTSGYMGIYTNTNSHTGVVGDNKYIPPDPQANLHILDAGLGKSFVDDNELQVRVRLQANKNPGQATAQYGEIGFIRSSDAKTTIDDISDKNDRGIFLNTNQFRTTAHDFLFNSKGHMSMGFIKTASDAQLHIGNNYNLIGNKGKTGSDDNRICIQIQSTEDTHHSIGNMENKDLYIQADENLRILKQNATKGQTTDTALIINKDGKIGLDTDITGTDYSVQTKNLLCKNNLRVDGELFVKGSKSTFDNAVLLKDTLTIEGKNLSCKKIIATELSMKANDNSIQSLTGEKIKSYDALTNTNISHSSVIGISAPIRGAESIYELNKRNIKISNDLYVNNDIFLNNQLLTSTIVERIKTIGGDINTQVRDYHFQRKTITAEQKKDKKLPPILRPDLNAKGLYSDKYLGLGVLDPEAMLHIKDDWKVNGGDSGGNRLLVLEAKNAPVAIKKVDFSLGYKTYDTNTKKSKLMIRFYDDNDLVDYRLNPKFQLDEDGRCLFGTGQLEKDIQLKVNGKGKFSGELIIDGALTPNGNIWNTNNKLILAKNPSGKYEETIRLRDDLNRTLIKFGSGGFVIQESEAHMTGKNSWDVKANTTITIKDQQFFAKNYNIYSSRLIINDTTQSVVNDAQVFINRGIHSSYIWMRGRSKHEFIFAQEWGANKIYSREYNQNSNGGNVANGVPLQFRIGDQLVMEMKKEQIHLKKDLYNKDGNLYGFLDLSGTPNSFTADKFLKVNSNGDSIEFVDKPTSTTVSNHWTKSGDNVYRQNGKVGIGISDPQSTLDVLRNIRLSSGTKRILNLDFVRYDKRRPGTNSFGAGVYTDWRIDVGENGEGNMRFIYSRKWNNEAVGEVIKQQTLLCLKEGGFNKEGCVGINNENPISKLDVRHNEPDLLKLTNTERDSNNYFNSLEILVHGRDNTAATSIGSYKVNLLNEKSAKSIHIHTGPDIFNGIQINKDGKLGVGKYANEMLDVDGSVKATSYKIGSKELTEAKITKLDGLPSTFTSGHWTKNDANNNLTYDAGKIGIGVNPSALLHVQSTAKQSPIALFKSIKDVSLRLEGLGGESYLEIANNKDTSKSWGIGMNDSTDLVFTWKNNGSLNNSATTGGGLLTVKSNGNVGINKTDPTEKLEVVGSVKATSLKLGAKELTESKITKLDGLPSTIPSQHWSKNSTGKLSYTNGFVGIGVDTPLSQFHVKQSGNAEPLALFTSEFGDCSVRIDSNGDSYLELINSNSILNSWGMGILEDESKLKFSWGNKSQFSGDSVLTLDTTGKIGIGTHSPSAELHIYKKDSSTGTTLKIESDGGSGSNQPDSKIEFLSNDGNPANPTSSADTYVASQIVSGWTSGLENWNDSYIKFKTHGSNTASLTDDLTIRGGNVGINKNNPDEKLDVNGSVKATSYKIGSKELTEAKITKLDGLPSTFTGGSSHWTKNSDNKIYYSSANVGINTNNPSERLDVNGNINFVGDLYKNSSRFSFTHLSGTPNSFTANKYLQVNSNGDALIYVDAPDTNIWSENNTYSYAYYNGPVSINTTIMERDGSSLKYMLEVSGKIKCNTSLTIGSKMLLESDITSVKNIDSTIDGKITKLTNINSVPTQNSFNCVTSGGVWAALNEKQDVLTAGNGLEITSNTIRNIIWNTNDNSNDISFNGIKNQGNPKLGIGKIATEALDVAGNIKLNSDIIVNKNSGEAKIYTMGDGSSLKLSAGSGGLNTYIKLIGGSVAKSLSSMKFVVSNGEKMSINNDGNVYIGDIGKKTYDEKLEVLGSVKADNFKIDDKILTKTMLTSLQDLDGTSITKLISTASQNRETAANKSIDTAKSVILSDVERDYVSKKDSTYLTISNKQNTLVSGTGIKIDKNVISSTVVAGIQKSDINGAVSGLIDKNLIRDRIIISDSSGKVVVSDVAKSSLDLLKSNGLSKTINDGLKDKQDTITGLNRLNTNLVGTGEVGNDELNKLIGLDGDTIKKRFTDLTNTIKDKLNTDTYNDEITKINNRVSAAERSLFTADKNREHLQNIEDIENIKKQIEKLNNVTGINNKSVFWWNTETEQPQSRIDEPNSKIYVNKNIELEKFLMEKQKEFETEHPFHYCVCQNLKGDVVKFINLGIDVNRIDENGDTALHRLSRFGMPNMASLLFVSGADLNKQNIKGKTALMIALKNKNMKMIEFLNSKKVDLEILDNNGKGFEFYVVDETDETINELYKRKDKIVNIDNILQSDDISEYQLKILIDYNKRIISKMDMFLKK